MTGQRSALTRELAALAAELHPRRPLKMPAADGPAVTAWVYRIRELPQFAGVPDSEYPDLWCDWMEARVPWPEGMPETREVASVWFQRVVDYILAELRAGRGPAESL